MLDFHYNYIKAKYNCSAKSLCTDDLYEEFHLDKDLFDFSNQVIDKMKDEVKKSYL